ncbi:sensor histidine kinase [Maribellus sediminis]|uniref:sensor histidine kinase n=1 Tax=Maribellus sediminis TaxID=2696285 RepID=UPI0014312924|nr:histidine kinase [Maribellus sediminis]
MQKTKLTYAKSGITVILSAVIILWLSSVGGYAQKVEKEFSFKHYTIHDGLAQMQVMSLFQDSRGYLWCSTKAGISRFDGTRFVNYPNAPMTGGHDIVTMGETSHGHLLLFGTYGFTELREDTLLYYSYPDNATSSSLIQHSQPLKKKEIRRSSASGESEQLLVMDYSDPENLKKYEVLNGYGKISLIDSLAGSLVWQTNVDSIVVSNLKTGQVLRSYTNEHQIIKLFRNKNCVYGYNKKSEIYKLTNGIFKLLVATGLENQYFKAIATPENDGLILMTDKELYLFKHTLQPIKHNLTFIRDILFDNEDNLWVATEEGLYNFFQLNFVNFKFNMGNKDWVWSVLEDDSKNFWFASYQNGLWKWDGKSVTDFTETLNCERATHLKQRPLPQQYRYYMGASKLGSTLFFPTECNVLRYENRKFSPVEELPELPFQITKTYPNGSLFCGGYPGLFEIRNNKLVNSWDRDTLGVSSVLNFEHDKNNNLLVIGKNGAALIKKNSIKHFNSEELQFSYSLAKDHRKNIWIGGIQNVHLFNGDSIKFVSSRNEEAFYSLLFVEPHYLLLGGIKGLYVANLEEYYSTGIFEAILYNQSNGFTGIECGQNGFLTDSEGMVWIPTSDLVTRFDPQKLINKTISPPRIYLLSYSSADNIHWQAEQASILKSFEYHRNNLRFEIDAVSFANSGNIRYHYRLKGLNDLWSEATETNEITYYNLKPGRYEFEVKADAGVSRASSEILKVVFEIEPPYWMKWWFIVCALLILHALVFGLILRARYREKQKAAVRQRLTQLRSEALAAQLDPHFVMNCLNNISGMVNAGLKEQANEYILKFSKLLRVILQSVKKETISLNSEIEIVQNYLELEQFRCNDCFSFEIKLPRQHSTQRIMVPPIMLQPLVENSIKHGFGHQKISNAKISIRIEIHDNELHVSVCDNGIGLNKQSPSLGTGLGTRITRERIELLQKRRNIQFEVLNCNPGTEVRFFIPLLVKTEESV